MIVVIAASSYDALLIARQTQAGMLPPLYTSVEDARERALALYPAPQWARYLIFEFPNMRPGESRERFNVHHVVKRPPLDDEPKTA